MSFFTISLLAQTIQANLILYNPITVQLRHLCSKRHTNSRKITKFNNCLLPVYTGETQENLVTPRNGQANTLKTSSAKNKRCLNYGLASYGRLSGKNTVNKGQVVMQVQVLSFSIDEGLQRLSHSPLPGTVLQRGRPLTNGCFPGKCNFSVLRAFPIFTVFF